MTSPRIDWATGVDRGYFVVQSRPDMSDETLPRISIAVPSGDMVHAAFAMAFAQLCHASHALALQIVSVKSSIVAIARNNAVAEARHFGAQYLLFLDSDMIFPPTALLRLLIRRVDIVGATYVKRVPPYDVLGTALAEQPAEASGLIEMSRIPTGCLLIRMSVFEALTPPFFRFDTDSASGAILGEDYVFCDAARRAGFRIWCDSTLTQEMGHIGQQIFRLPSPPTSAQPEDD